MEAPKILIVDDESRMRKLVRDFLEKKNFQVLEAGDGEEAMDIFYEEKDIALILLDVMMPKMDGWEVCREIRKDLTLEWMNTSRNRLARRFWLREWRPFFEEQDRMQEMMFCQPVEL